MEAFLESLGTRGPALFAVAGLFALAFLIGRPWVRRDPELGAADKVFLALILGFDLLAIGAVPLASWGVLAVVPLCAVFAVALALVAFQLVTHARRNRPSSLPWHALVFVVLALVFLCHGLSYPFSWDDLVYQVAVPLRWHETNSLQVFPDNPYSGFPGAFSVLNLLLIDAGGVLAPGVFNAGLWLVLALQLVSLLRANMGRWSSTIFALSFALSWPALIEAISAYAELFLALHLAAIVCLWMRTKASALCVQVQLGFLAGAAASIKLTGMIVPVLTIALLAGGAWLRGPRSARTVLVRAGAFLLTLFAVPSLFYSRPALATGNPLHPYFASYFTDDEAAVASSVYHHDAGTARFGVPLELSAGTAGHFLGTPFALALGPFGDMAAFDGQIGLQFVVHFLLLGHLAFARLRGRAPVGEPWMLLAGACALYAFWFLTSQQARFLMPACFLLTLAASFAWPLLSWVPRAALSAALPVLALVSVPRDNYYLAARACGVQTGAVSPLEYIDFANPDRYIYACQGILENTPPDARVLLLFEQRGLYIPRAYRIGTPFFQGRYFTPSERTRTREEFLAVLAEEHITHVLVGYNPNDPDRMESYLERTRPFQELLLSLIGHELEVVFELKENEGGQARHGLYEVAPR
jgi:hypothetical protein